MQFPELFREVLPTQPVASAEKVNSSQDYDIDVPQPWAGDTLLNISSVPTGSPQMKTSKSS